MCVRVDQLWHMLKTVKQGHVVGAAGGKTLV